MLKADQVEARRYGNQLKLVKLEGKRRRRAEELAAQYTAVIKEGVGSTRSALRERLAGVDVAARERKLAGGLLKLLDDACTWTTASELDPADIRREVFGRASARRAALGPGLRFSREALLAEIAHQRGITAEAVERALYADLKDEQVLQAFQAVTAEALVARYLLVREQAVLLRSTQVVVEVHDAAPEAYRYLFRQLKFRRLLYRLQPIDEGGYRITLDGPYSLFESVTRYGLQLALVLPAIKSLERYRIDAELRWGKGRRRLHFVIEGRGREPSAPRSQARDEPAALALTFVKLGSDWTVEAAEELLDLPGVGLCVPDLVFQHRPSGERIYFEALGFWSRQAVWKRIDLVQKGLASKILFAVSRRLRVSKAALDGHSSGALYVYKGGMNAGDVLAHLEKLRKR
jgi:predicted nuclease of restriction endonuclease-like RecB superfamily